MTDNAITLTHTSLFDMEGPNGLEYGCNQGWYPHFWKRQSGCGPSTASNQFAYLANTVDGAENLCVIQAPFDKDHFLKQMLALWRYITPGMGGVNSTAYYAKGGVEFAKSRGFHTIPFVFDVTPCNKPRKNTLEEAVTFIKEGLEKECPVAFLNLDNGEEKTLHHWHWVTITGVFDADGDTFVTVSDEGRKKDLNFSLWYNTTKKDGGLVYFTL